LLDACDRHTRSESRRRGDILIREGEAADCVYVVLEGTLEVSIARPDGTQELVDILEPGTCIGDMALLLGTPRTATVRALRDARLLCLAAEGFQSIVGHSPEVSSRLARLLGKRLERTTHRRGRMRPVRSVAIVGNLNDSVCLAFCQDFSRALDAASERVRFVGEQDFLADGTAVLSSDSSSTWFNAQEKAHQYVFYACHIEIDRWTELCLRRADLVLVVGNGNSSPPLKLVAQLSSLVEGTEPRPRLELVLLHQTEPPFGGTHRWLKNAKFAAWHHLRTGRLPDHERFVRRLLGRGIGVVLSGGGARGFAHLGVLKAICEASLPIDFIAGTSMGAIIAAQYAVGYDLASMIEVNRAAYVGRQSLSDLAIPYVALRDGSATNRTLRNMFGALRIEDLMIPYFCVSASLNRAETVVHDRGRLWLWARASCSVPGLLPPVRYRGDLLVDGGLLDNLPVTAMRLRCHGHIIASDVSVAVDFQDSFRPAGEAAGRARRMRFGRKLRPPIGMPGIGHILMRTVSLGSVRDARVAADPADLYLHPPLDRFGMSDFGKLDELVAIGAEHARVRLAAWARAEQYMPALLSQPSTQEASGDERTRAR
jgi:NTE family protein